MPCSGTCFPVPSVFFLGQDDTRAMLPISRIVVLFFDNIFADNLIRPFDFVDRFDWKFYSRNLNRQIFCCQNFVDTCFQQFDVFFMIQLRLCF